MSWPTFCAAASVNRSGGASVPLTSLLGVSLMTPLSDFHWPHRLYLGAPCRFCHRPLALMNQLTVDFGANRHLDELVLDVADHAGLGTELHAFRGPYVALHGAVQQHMRNHHRALDAAALADAQDGPLVVGRPDVALDVAVDVEAAGELDVSVYACVRPDQRSNRRVAARFSTQHCETSSCNVGPSEALALVLRARLARDDLYGEPLRLEADRQHDLAFEPLKIAELVGHIIVVAVGN